jgi:hypothetical protein
MVGKYVVVRTYSAGVHVGVLKSKEGLECTLENARRIYYWEGAATLSQLAMHGTSKPGNCKFPCEVDEILLQWIEIIPCTDKARYSIKSVPVWAE